MISCSSCIDPVERADCLELVGDIAHLLKQSHQAINKYLAAARADQLNPQRRWKLIEALQENGQDAMALEQAKKARHFFPRDNRFAQFIEQNSSPSPSTGLLID